VNKAAVVFKIEHRASKFLLICIKAAGRELSILALAILEI